MADYKDPRPSPTASAADPCVIYDNAVSFNNVLNTDTTVTTYTGKELLTLSQAIDKFGFGVAPFTFAVGGTLDSLNLLVSNSPTDGFLYKYVGAGSAPIIVSAGIDPTISADWQAFAATSLQALSGLTEPSDLTHNTLSGLNVVGGHDSIYRRKTTVAEVATGVFSSGDLLALTDRDNAPFKVVGVGWPESVNGMDVLDAGGGKSALHEYVGEINIVHIGAIRGATTDPETSSPHLQRAATLGVPAYAPSGSYRVTYGIQMSSEGFTMRGDGNATTFDCIMTDYFIKFPTSSGRSVKKFKDFNVYSTAGTMSASGCAFLFDGSGTGGVLAYTSGYHFSGIEIGGGGEFACGWDLTDTFRLTIRDCGYSFVSNPIKIRGSVVQCTVDNLTGNNNDFARNYKGQNCGVHMSSRSDYSDGLTRVPENVKIMNSGFVQHRIGMASLGLAIASENNDFDFIQDTGWVYAGGNGHMLRGGYIAHRSGDYAFVGASVSKASDMEAIDIVGVTFNTYSVGSQQQTAVQIGSGDASPYAETAGVVVRENKVFGTSASWNFGVQADRNRRLTISDNRFATGVIKAGGKAINASNSKNLTLTSNTCNGQAIYVSAPVADSVGTVTDNEGALTTEFMAGTFEVARNRAISS
jgi:hypothetical protein